MSISLRPGRCLSESNEPGARLDHVCHCRFDLRQLPHRIPTVDGVSNVEIAVLLVMHAIAAAVITRGLTTVRP
jgi:hypothetical protein